MEEATLSLQYLPIPLSPQHFLEEAQEPKLPQLLYHYDSCPYLTLHSTLYGRPRGPNTRGYSTTMISVHTSLSTALYMGGPEAQTPQILYNYDICLYLTLHSTLYGRPIGPNTRRHSTTIITAHAPLSTALYMGGPEAQTPAVTLLL